MPSKQIAPPTHKARTCGTVDRIVEQLARHDRVKPGDSQPGELAHRIGEGLQTGPLMVVGCHLKAESNERRCVDRVGEKIKDRSRQEDPEIKPLGMTAGQLPHGGENKARQHGADQDVGTAAAPPRLRMVGDITHHRIGHGIKQPWHEADHADQDRVHPQPQIENYHHGRHGGCLQIIDKHAHGIGRFLDDRDAIFRARRIMVYFRHVKPAG